MKKFLAALLIIAYCLSVCACGKNTTTSSAENVAGTYKNITFLSNISITLDEEGRYDSNSFHRRGTYTGNLDGGFTLLDSNGYNETIFAKKDSYYYRTTLICCFDHAEGTRDEAPKFTNGVSDQWFTAYYDSISDNEWKVIILELKEDGTFRLRDCTRTLTSQTDGTLYEGTYTLDGYVLELNYGEDSMPFLFIDDKIYFDVYEKQ